MNLFWIDWILANKNFLTANFANETNFANERISAMGLFRAISGQASDHWHHVASGRPIGIPMKWSFWTANFASETNFANERIGFCCKNRIQKNDVMPVHQFGGQESLSKLMLKSNEK